ncbi:ragulator complex protein LAMTOR3 [Agrilus planipennis]|uniref:Ragulator complex protein LAMTOR3 n=1 Tax=Agrilus planipennis TaxID=224129 RepID=A0A1W4XEI9_AGRPL|nr:ragulator complex protein LAMTOR3 [Agrilus planipennis]
MVEEIKKNILQMIQKVPGVYSVLITDRDGVQVLKVNTDKAPEIPMRPGFLSTFALAVDQGGKLGLGKTKTLICSYPQYLIVQMNKLPLVVTFIANNSCNVGHILALEKQIEPTLSVLSLAVGETYM